jgi:hypothetical protein
MEVDAPLPPPRPAGSRVGLEDYVTDEAFPRILELIEEAELQELLLNAVSSSDDF